jgi:3D (Asp-Asp-Asp) domain-containing protein
VGRGARRWGSLLAAVVCGVVSGSVLPASGADSASYRLRVDAVAYHLPGRTASGLPVGKGIVAVDPKLIPLGTRLFVPGYGKAVAADVGYAIKGRIIDLWMPSDTQARAWGRKTVVITIHR